MWIQEDIRHIVSIASQVREVKTETAQLEE